MQPREHEVTAPRVAVPSQSVSRRSVLRRHWKRLLGLVILIFLVTIPAVVATALRDSLPGGDAVGYAMVALLSFAGSASIALPLPGMAVVCGASVALFPLLVGIIGAVAETAGETTGYLAGMSGRTVLEPERHRWYGRVHRVMHRHASLILFTMSAIPNPLFDFAGVAAGMLRVPLWRFYLSVLPGKLVKDILTAYACVWGIGWVQRLLSG